MISPSRGSPSAGRRPRPPSRTRLVATLACVLLAACTERFDQIPAQGAVASYPVETTVDAPIARYHLERQASARAPEPELEQRVQAARAQLTDGVPSREELARLSRDHSTDLATLFLIEALAAVPEHARLQASFEEHMERVRMLDAQGIGALRACTDALELPVVWFVPGWFYIDNPATGADFHRQRALLERLGVEHRLVPLIENGTIEANAAILADELRTVEPGQAIMLVSASKGGPEVAHAIGHLLSPEETGPVRAWVNVGGLLRGSPIADWATSWPVSWVAPLYFRFVEQRDPGDSVASMTTARSEARLAREQIPEHVMIINFLGVPLSGHVTQAAEFGYGRMRSDGPNDGLTPVIDKLAHGGGVILQIGLDHYYRDPELDLKTVALALTVVTELGDALPPACLIESS